MSLPIDSNASRRNARHVYNVDNYDLAQFLSVADSFGADKYGYVLTPNIDGFVSIRENPAMLKAYEKSSYVLLDSRVAGFLFRLFFRVKIPVCPGSDLTAAMFHHVIKPDDKVLVVGSSESQIQQLRRDFGIKDLVHYNPPMGFIHDPLAVEACLQFIENAGAVKYCLIAVGDPQGAIVAHRLAERGRARGLAFVIGASIDFMTGKQRRAPRWMQHMGFEWFYRLMSNPRRLAKRYLLRCPRFLLYLPSSRLIVRNTAAAQAK